MRDMDEYDSLVEYPRAEARRCEDCSHYECCSADGFIGGCYPEFPDNENTQED